MQTLLVGGSAYCLSARRGFTTSERHLLKFHNIVANENDNAGAEADMQEGELDTSLLEERKESLPDPPLDEDEISHYLQEAFYYTDDP